MKYENISVERLIPYVNNARKHSEQQVAQIAASIRQFGFLNPILVDKDNGVIAGHGRLLGAQKLGLAEVPCVRVEHLTPAQKKAYIIADNRLAETSTWDNELLKLELEDLKLDNFDLELTGFDTSDIDAMLNPGTEGLTDPDDVPEVKPEAKSKLGDVWLLGDHRVMCGDSTDAASVAILMNGQTPLMMFTDPPYGVNLDQSWRDKAHGSKAMGKGNKNIIANDDRADWTETYKLFSGDVAYVWHASWQTDIVKKNLEDCDLQTKQMIIWNKSIMVMGRSNYHWKHEPCWYCVRKGKTSQWSGDHKQTTVWDAPSPNHIMSGSKDDKTEHPSQKPISICEIGISNHGKKGDIVYDPFLGSGSTLIACEKTGRKCFGMELSPQYCDVILSRWQSFSGKKAIREADLTPFDDVAPAS